MTIESVLKELLGTHFSNVSNFCLDFIKRSQKEDGVRKTFDYLQKLDITTEDIANFAYLLGRDQNIIQDHHEKLINLKINKQKINTCASLLGRNPDTIQDNRDKLISLGISEQKINTHAYLLGMNPDTIKDHYKELERLGISEKKIAMNAQLLGYNPETIQKHCKSLIDLGISPQKIAQNAQLLDKNPDTIKNHYDYLTNVIKLDEVKIQNQPQLLWLNPDAFAKKLRIIKLDILGLRRNDAFNPIKYTQFYLSSPATLLARKNYCLQHKIDVLNNINILMRSWRKIIKIVDKTVSDDEADKKGKRMTRPYKQRYDNWMSEYRKWCREFYLRRGRRLIVKV